MTFLVTEIAFFVPLHAWMPLLFDFIFIVFIIRLPAFVFLLGPSSSRVLTFCRERSSSWLFFFFITFILYLKSSYLRKKLCRGHGSYPGAHCSAIHLPLVSERGHEDEIDVFFIHWRICRRPVVIGHRLEPGKGSNVVIHGGGFVLAQGIQLVERGSSPDF